MNIKSDQLKCYLEGINIPIKSIKTESKRNTLTSAMIEIPVSEPIVPKMWANAFIQVTCIVDQNGTRREKLLFQGLCTKMNVMESKGTLLVWASSVFSSLNLNTTLDYTAPKRYSVFNLQGEESKIFIGNESEVNIIEPKTNDSYQLANRYFFLPKEAKEQISISQLTFDEKMKLEYIINKTPFAELFAYTFFEDISYQNFILSRSYIERFNLLSKSESRYEITKKERDFSEKSSIGLIELDFSFTGIYYRYASFTRTGRGFDSNFSSSKSSYPYKPISEKAKNDILSVQKYWKNQCTIDEILSDYEKYSQQMNVDPNLLIAQAKQESEFNPGKKSNAGAVGWAQFMPGTWPSYAPPDKKYFSHAVEVRASIYAQCNYMSWLLSYFKDDMKKAMMGYNAGQNFNQENPPPQAVAYWSDVINIYNSYVK